MLPIHRYALNGKKDSIQSLLKRKPSTNLNVKNEIGSTPLIIAARSGHFSVVDLLVKKNADLHITTFSGQNCLHAAVASLTYKTRNKIKREDDSGSKKDYYKIIRLLLQKDISLLTSKNGKCTCTPLKIAELCPEVVKQLYKIVKALGYENMLSSYSTVTNDTAEQESKLSASQTGGLFQQLRRRVTRGRFFGSSSDENEAEAESESSDTSQSIPLLNTKNSRL